MKRKFSILMLVLVGLLALIAFRSSRQKGVQNENLQVKETPVVDDSSAGARTEKSEPLPLPSAPGEGNTPVRRVPGESIPEEVTHAALYGAKARVSLHVIDSKGNDVSGAEVTGSFAGTKNPAELYKVLTDDFGCVTLDAVHAGYMVNLSVCKENYYVTRTAHHFNRRGWICVKAGRWIPWNPTLEVVLKEKRKPIPMYQNFIEAVMPAGTNRLGFDFLVGDWVAPHGKGKIADMWYVYDENFIDRDNFFIKLSFVFPGEHNGCYMRKMDNYSELMSMHEALDTEITPSKICVIEQEKGKYTKELRFAEDDYMVFRIRTKTDEQGKIASAHYGKVYGPVGVPHRWSRKFSFTYYLNPTLNDRNLEYDPQKNLIPDGQRHTMNRNLP
jgi:hypothetical protein